MPETDTIQVTISLDAPPVTRAGLGTPLVVGSNGTWGSAGDVTEYATMAEAEADGYSSSEYEHKALTNIFGQNSRVSSAKVGILDTFVAQVDTVSVGGSPGAGDYLVTINGTEFKHTSPGGETQAQIVAALVALVNAGSQPVTAADASPDMTLTADVAGIPFTTTVSAPSDKLTLAYTTPNEGYYESMALMQASDPDWWAVVIETRTSGHIREAARYAETNKKFLVYQTSEATCLTSGDTTNVGYLLNALSRLRSLGLYYSDDSVAAAEAWCGHKLAVDPDSTTTYWAHATLVGVTPDTLTTAQQTALESYKLNWYGYLGSLGATYWGTLADGRYADVLVTRDWFDFRVTEDLQQQFSNISNRGSKPPLTDAGIESIAGTVRTRLQLGVDYGHFSDDPHPSVTPTRRADMAQADVDARLIRMSFQAQLAGAIHKTALSGYLATTLP